MDGARTIPTTRRGSAADSNAMTAQARVHATVTPPHPSSIPSCHFQAVKSLKQYPLPLRSGQESKILEGIGDKIANMLDKRLAKHSADTGTRVHYHHL